MEGAVETSTAAAAPAKAKPAKGPKARRGPRSLPSRSTPWRRPGPEWRAFPTRWEEHPIYLCLHPLAARSYRWLWAMSGGQYDVGVPAARAAIALNMSERSWRRSTKALVMYGLVDLVKQGGGAHANCNSYRSLAIDQDYVLEDAHRPVRYASLHYPEGVEAPPKKRTYMGRSKAAPAAAVDAPASQVASQAAPAETASDVATSQPSEEVPPTQPAGSPKGPAPATVPTSDAPKLRTMPASLLATLVTSYADFSGSPIEDVRAELALYDNPTLWMLARRCGVDLPDEAPADVPSHEDPARLARHMVEHVRAACGIQRAAWATEIGEATNVVRHSGADAWSRYSQALSHMVGLMNARKWKRPPYAFGYLRMHLFAVKALPVYTPPDDEQVVEAKHRKRTSPDPATA